MRPILSAILLISSLTLYAQETSDGIKGVLMNIKLEAASAEIQITYDLSLSESSDLQLKFLNFDAVPISDFQALVDGVMIKSSFMPNGKMTTVKLLEQESFSAKGNSKLILNYQVPITSEDRFDLTIPVVYPDLSALNSDQEFFKGTLSTPEAYSIYELFPTSAWESQTTGFNIIHSMTLQALPSMIKVRGGSSPKPFLSTLGLIDAVVILVLIVLMGLGWKKIKEV